MSKSEEYKLFESQVKHNIIDTALFDYRDDDTFTFCDGRNANSCELCLVQEQCTERDSHYIPIINKNEYELLTYEYPELCI